MGRIVVDGSGPPYVAGGDDYRITVDGDVVKASGATDQDSVVGGQISGQIGDGTDSYEFRGTVISASIPSHSDLYVDGEKVAPSELPIRSGSTSGGSSGSSGSSSSSAPTASTPTAPTGSPSTPAPATAGIGGGNTALLAGAAALALLAVYMVQS